jgi:enolase
MLRIGLDFAASQLWDGKSYSYPSGERLGKSQQLSYVEDLVRRYPIAYVEDPFHEDDFVSFSVLTHRISPKLVCGDDLFSTNLGRLRKGIEHKAANAILLKPNQIGTITDVMRVAEEAKKAGMVRVFSHRSGETEDVLICHLAVGLGCECVKFGIGGERVVKLNEMLRIEERI